METHVEQWLDAKQKLPAPSLAGVAGTVAFEAGIDARWLLTIDNGEVELTSGPGEAQAVVKCDSKAVAERLLRGEGNPVVSALQGHLTAEGDRALALKVALGLLAGSPFSTSGTAPQEAEV
ncbi:MAG TPA: SCP2 sterol-binding domain-containing protein [Gemmatimonadales bacterium]|nr:SCP2 sterol-binding domain-containing protein [Gemmatimonadales bacterium]